MKVVLTAEAERDLDDVFGYLFDRNPEAARRLVEQVFHTAQMLADGLVEGAPQTLSSGESVNSWPIPPYRLYYTRSQHALVVVRIYHQRRKPL